MPDNWFHIYDGHKRVFFKPKYKLDSFSWEQGRHTYAKQHPTPFYFLQEIR